MALRYRSIPNSGGTHPERALGGPKMGRLPAAARLRLKNPWHHGSDPFARPFAERGYFIIFIAVWALWAISGCATPPRPASLAGAGTRQAPILIDHRCTRIERIPPVWIAKARTECRVACGCSPTGLQILAGLENLELQDRRFSVDRLGGSGGLALFTDELRGDLGTPDAYRWADRTRFLLEKGWGDVNVVVWSWGDQLTRYSEKEVGFYLHQMAALEERFPGVAFVYMTAPLDGSGTQGNVHRRNQQIRLFCRDHNKILYDFGDIERFDPDGVDYLAKGGDFGCYYRDNGSVKNWAEEWCRSHAGSCTAYDCPSSKPLNCDLKARAFWWLLARTAGWNPQGDESGQDLSHGTRDNPSPQ